MKKVLILFILLVALVMNFMINPMVTHAAGTHSHDNESFDGALSQSDFDSPETLPQSGSYYLASDIEVSKDIPWHIKGNNTFKLCLNGHKITYTGTGDHDAFLEYDYYVSAFIKADGDTTFELYDCGTETHKHKVDESGVVVDDSLSSDYLTFTGGYITNFNATFIRSSGRVSVHGVSFVSNKSHDGAIHVAHGTLAVDGCNFISNKAGAIIYEFDKDSDVQIKNANFLYNSASQSNSHGAAIFFENAPIYSYEAGANHNYESTKSHYFNFSATIENCHFENNTASYGGAIYYESKCIVTADINIKNTEFKNNTADVGGAICFGVDGAESDLGAGTISLHVSDNTVMTGNKATEAGGAIYAWGQSKVKLLLFLNNSTITDNEADIEGGAIYMAGTYSIYLSEMDIRDSEITNNKAKNGGAITGINAVLKLAGLVKITDNKNADDKNDDIYILDANPEYYKAPLIIEIPEELSNGSKIGIGMINPGDYSQKLTANEAKSYKKYFYSNNEGYGIRVNSETSQLSLAEGASNSDDSHGFFCVGWIAFIFSIAGLVLFAVYARNNEDYEEKIVKLYRILGLAIGGGLFLFTLIFMIIHFCIWTLLAFIISLFLLLVGLDYFFETKVDKYTEKKEKLSNARTKCKKGLKIASVKSIDFFIFLWQKVSGFFVNLWNKIFKKKTK